MSITLRSLAVLSLLTCCVPSASAQYVNPAPTAEWAQRLFDVTKVDFGVIATGSESKKLIRLRNPHQQTVHIVSATTTCGCSVATPSQRTIKPGEESTIEVTMDTRKFKRRKDSNLIVTFDAPSYASVRIPITAYIRTDVVFDPGMAQFGPLEVGKGSQKKISIAYAGRNDWRIRELKIASPHLTGEFNEVRRAAGRVDYELDVTLKPSVPVGQFRALITLVTDDASNPYVPLLVEAAVEPDIAVVPGVISLGAMGPGQEKRTRVVLRGKRPFEVQRVECASGDERFDYRKPSTSGLVQVIPLTVTSPAKPGKFEEVFSVWIAGRDEPVRFRATGVIAR